MTIRLTCVDKVSSISSERIESLPSVIGRGEEADLQIRDHWSSRCHCRLFERDGRLMVADLQSCNGTRVNGERIEEVELHSGDRLTIGITTVRVTFSRLPLSTVRETDSQLVRS